MIQEVSPSISFDRSPGRLSVVISARASAPKRYLLLLWLLAWLACGIIVILERRQIGASDPMRQFLLAFLAFWAYYLVVIGKALLWRWFGMELWRVKDGILVIKDSVFGFGRATSYFVDNIQALGLLKVDPSSWKAQWNNSLWVVGGQRLGFEHIGRKVIFGKGLDEADARRLAALLKEVFREQRAAKA
jgi:hypothetical protein